MCHKKRQQTKYSNCFVEALRNWNKYDNSLIQCTFDGSRGWWPHWFVILPPEYDHYIEFRGVKDGLNSIQSLCFEGYTRKMPLKHMDKVIRKNRLKRLQRKDK